jgi:hypothetical protein
LAERSKFRKSERPLRAKARGERDTYLSVGTHKTPMQLARCL